MASSASEAGVGVLIQAAGILQPRTQNRLEEPAGYLVVLRVGLVGGQGDGTFPEGGEESGLSAFHGIGAALETLS